MTKIKELFFKYKELIVYLIYGVLATVVNFFAFWCFTKLFGEDAYLLNNALSWVVSVIFAFVSNKIFVFESKSWAFKTAGKEFIEFVGARLFSFGVFAIKNISKEKLNIDPDELTERFVRGDNSRTTDGSGLGLSIARSFAELQNGIFNIEIDGDMFKAIVKLPLI